MVLFEILSSKFSVCALGESQTDCELRSFFSGLESNLEKDGRRMLGLLKRVAQRGVDLNTDICHQIEGKIFQFRQGRIRVLWFYDQNRIILCTHGFVKATGKTPRGEKEHAKLFMNKYFEKKQSGPLKIVPWDEV